MKILQVVPLNPNASGVTSVVLDLIQNLVHRGHRVGVLNTGQSAGVVRDRLIGWGVKLYDPETNSRDWLNPFRWLQRNVPDFSLYDLAHIHTVYNPLHGLAYRALASARIPYVVSLHGSLMPGALRLRGSRKRLFLRTVVARIFDLAAITHVLNVEENQAFQQYSPGSATWIIPNGVSDDVLLNIDQERRELPVLSDAGQTTFVFLGRLDVYYKGLDVLLDAIALRYSEIRSAGIQLLLVGPFHSAKDERYIRKRAFSLEPIVKLVPPVFGQEKIALLRSCDVLVYPSRSEGMPMSVLEALAVGKPCLVTPGSNMASIVVETGAGATCELTATSLAESMLRMAQVSRADLTQMGVKGAEWCRGNASWSRLTPKYEEMYAAARGAGIQELS